VTFLAEQGALIARKKMEWFFVLAAVGGVVQLLLALAGMDTGSSSRDRPMRGARRIGGDMDGLGEIDVVDVRMRHTVGKSVLGTNGGWMGGIGGIVTLPLFPVFVNPRFTRPFCAVP
jgi:hypothetical protein